jgi:transposase
MARYRHYDPWQTKMIAVSYGRQLLPGTFERALDHLIDNEIELGSLARSTATVVTERLQRASGIGLITATALSASVGEVDRFPSGRHFASSPGPTPR